MSSGPPSRIARALRRLHWAALLPWLVLFAGLAATHVLRQQTLEIEQQDLRAHFQDQAEDIAGRIEQRSRAYEKILRGAALFVEDAGPGALARYWDGLRLEQSFPGVQSLAVALIVPARDKGQLEALRRHGFPRLVIRPEGARGLYAPIVAIEPQSTRNLNVLGYDPYAEAVRREAMERSRDSNRRALSGKVKLFDEPIAGPQAGAVMWVPVFRRAAARQTEAERRANIVAWVSFTFRVGDFVGGMRSAQDAGIALELYDGERAAADALLYATGPAESGKGRAPLFAMTKHIEIGGRAWTLHARSLPAFEAGVNRTRVDLVQWAGTALSLLLALLAWLLLGLRDKARALARELTRELRESEVRWKFAIEGSGDGLWDWNVADGRIYYSPRWKSILGYAEDEVKDHLSEWERLVHAEDRSRALATTRSPSGAP